jgi:hypothetical protein
MLPVLTCSGINFPSENSSSAGSIVMELSNRNSKSPESRLSSGSSDCRGAAAADDLVVVVLEVVVLLLSSSRVKEILGLNQP